MTTQKAFLGMGLLGSNFVKAMTQRGEKVQVWNRTASKAFELETSGVRAFERVEEAVKGAEIIHVTLKDDASVDEVLERASTGFAPGVVIIDHTTTSKEGSIRRTAYWKDRAFSYLHAPVFMGPANALAGTGYMLVSGEAGLISRVEPHLTPMTGKLMNLGEEAGKAAAVKLAGNTFLVCFTFSLRETLGVVKALGLQPSDLEHLLQTWNPGAQALSRLERLTSGDYSQPSWELAMARKDTQLFLDAARKEGVDLTLLPSIAGVMDGWIQNGFGSQDWTIVGKDMEAK